VALILLAGLIAYAGGLSGPFIFDDVATVVENPSIRDPGNLGAVFSPPEHTPVAGRPLVNLSLALNHGAGGLDVTGYHVVNLALHLTCALLVFGAVRQTLKDDGSSAAAIALIWTVHPLNSEVVDYVTQRTESLMALCYLLTLYGSIRAIRSKRPQRWQVLAVAACAAGTACKETIATAPLMVVLYDRVFVFPSVREAFHARGRFYGALAASWLLLGAFLLTGGQTLASGFDTARLSPWTYLLNQAQMLTRYLWLTIWPGPLVIYYGWPRTVTLADVWPYAVLIVALLALTGLALWRWPKIGFLAAWAFITLAPTSSVLPIATEVGAERRMYLALAGVIALAVAGIAWGARRYTAWQPGRAALAAAVLLSMPLAARTMARQAEYGSALTMAGTVLDRWPTPNAHNLVGTQLAAAGRHEEAIPHLREAAHGYPPARYVLGSELLAAGRVDEGISELRTFVRDEPALLASRAAHGLLANALAGQQDFAAAVPHYREYLAAHAEDANGWNGLGMALLQSGKRLDAIEAFRGAVNAAPGNPAFQTNLARALLEEGRLEEAAQLAGQSAAAHPNPAAHDILGRVRAVKGDITGARAEFMKALEIDPSYRPAQDGLAGLREETRQLPTPNFQLPR
jgi:tetratricopeptide (TPR) repeat protein